MLALLFTACNSAADNKSKKQPETIMQGFKLMLAENGKQKMQVQAQEARIPLDRSRARLLNPRIVQLQDGVASGTITAREGVYYFQDAPKEKRLMQDLVLSGQVIIRRPDGFTLRTDQAILSTAQNSLSSNATTRIHLPLQNGQIMETTASRFALNLLDGFREARMELRGVEGKQRANMKLMDAPVASAPVR